MNKDQLKRKDAHDEKLDSVLGTQRHEQRYKLMWFGVEWENNLERSVETKLFTCRTYREPSAQQNVKPVGPHVLACQLIVSKYATNASKTREACLARV